ncbi:hypothetical protein MA16_Dca026642 [Dendrobium catenatum]|uniref:Uncharacterized protein n=1 Tax=Dendrobium catenatum TaxID=906689 RepID=A0A2I0V793_9ASPA|nr:hypothetical protein MA16_Dca026642 [Dendrobium catenatum]
MAATWAQKTIVLPPQKRGCHLVTSKILKDIDQELKGFKCGLAHFFCKFLISFFFSYYVGSYSYPIGPDDMPAHIKSSMFGCALTVPITDGRLNLGTWQKSDHDDNSVHLNLLGHFLPYFPNDTPEETDGNTTAW